MSKSDTSQPERSAMGLLGVVILALILLLVFYGHRIPLDWYMPLP